MQTFIQKHSWIWSIIVAMLVFVIIIVEKTVQTPSALEPMVSIENPECDSQSYSCWAKWIETVTAKNGPENALSLLEHAIEDGSLSQTIDEHQLAHRVGRKAAEAYGMSGEVFLRCSTIFNYGCQHGFFEFAIGRNSTTRDAVDRICGTLERDDTYSGKFKFYCYHGVGHGVLMATAYDISAGLADCDSLRTSTGRVGCWQGLFMENVNAGMRGEARDGVFSFDDPLLPCSGLAEQYQRECYINHSGWLMRVFENDVARASRACLSASPNNINACLESIGLMISNPSWQPALTGGRSSGTLEQVAWDLCLQFPETHLSQCVIGGVENILNFDELDIGRAIQFCDTVVETERDVCYQRIGLSIRNQSTDSRAVRQGCSTIKSPFDQECLGGAGL